MALLDIFAKITARVRVPKGSAPSGKAVYSHVACQSGGYTFLEMLAVVAIIAILLSLLAPLTGNVRKHARQADCRSNLRQFGIALTVYRADNKGRNPPWLSNLYPEYIDNKQVYVCKSDPNKGLKELATEAVRNRQGFGQYSGENSPVDNESRPNRSSVNQNTDIKANSYFYEFSAAYAPRGWVSEDMNQDDDPRISWWEYKEHQLRYGDDGNGGSVSKPVPYSTSRMPIIRCWHHYDETKVRGYAHKASRITRQGITLNVAYAGNVLIAPPWWEGSLDPGE